MRSIENYDTEISYEYDNNNYIEYFIGKKVYHICVNKIGKTFFATAKDLDTAFIIFGMFQKEISLEKIEATLILLGLKK